MKWVLLLVCCITGLNLSAQPDDDITYTVNAATMVGAGRYNIMDTYLSPGSLTNYQGWALRIFDERMKYTHIAGGKVSRQQQVQIDFASTRNPAGTMKEYAGFIDYSLGYHYHFDAAPGLRLLAGASVHALLGGVYNTVSSNNPGSAKADLDLDISCMASYRLKIGDFPLQLRYQFQIPFAGMLFSPRYGESYYEIFQLGNSGGVIKFSSFHNKWAMKNIFTVDIPLPWLTIRTGYMDNMYYLDVNSIKSHLNSRYFMIGIVKEFISVKNKGGKKYRSAFY